MKKAENSSKTLNSLVKRYLTLKERRSKIDDEMSNLKEAIDVLMQSDSEEGRTWTAKRTVCSQKYLDKVKVQRIIGEKEMVNVYSDRKYVQIRINRKKPSDSK